jgi:hypothetical protein
MRSQPDSFSLVGRARSRQAQDRLSSDSRAIPSRYDGAGGIRPATAQEISDYEVAQVTEQSLGRFDSEKVVKALAIWVAEKLGVPVQTLRAEVLAIYRTL